MISRQQSIKRWVIIASATLVVLIAGIAAVLRSESRQRNEPNRQDLTEHSSPESITIKRPGKTDIKIRANPTQWQIHEPCTLTVNQQRLEPLLSILKPAAFSYAARQVDLEAAGLTTPLATLISNKQRIDIGHTDLSGERRYIKRGERVEFIPEWILPLLDGGLSALSVLNIFDEDIISVEIDSLTDKPLRLSDDPTNWQKLTAQQITPWPLTGHTPLQAQYSVAISSKHGNKRLQVFTTTDYIALVFDGARCAYLLPNAALVSAPH